MIEDGANWEGNVQDGGRRERGGGEAVAQGWPAKTPLPRRLPPSTLAAIGRLLLLAPPQPALCLCAL